MKMEQVVPKIVKGKWSLLKSIFRSAVEFDELSAVLI